MTLRDSHRLKFRVKPSVTSTSCNETFLLPKKETLEILTVCWDTLSNTDFGDGSGSVEAGMQSPSRQRFLPSTFCIVNPCRPTLVGHISLRPTLSMTRTTSRSGAAQRCAAGCLRSISSGHSSLTRFLKPLNFDTKNRCSDLKLLCSSFGGNGCLLTAFDDRLISCHCLEVSA